MKKYLLFTIVLLLFFGNSCCNKCKNIEDETINLTDQQKNFIQYSGTDTLYFLNDNNDSIIYYGQGNQESFKLINTEEGSCSVTKYEEEIKIIFISNIGDTIRISLTADHNNSVGLADLDHIINNHDFNYNVKEDGKNGIGWDTLSFDSFTYYNVYITSGGNDTNKFLKTYFTKNKGLVSYELPDGNGDYIRWYRYFF
ncbi:MAG: hypothetical protein JKY33_06895 [Bacteroidia bacterium]|nr:hypothetical protein [Bacteroidia bacterium]